MFSDLISVLGYCFLMFSYLGQAVEDSINYLITTKHFTLVATQNKIYLYQRGKKVCKVVSLKVIMFFYHCFVVSLILNRISLNVNVGETEGFL